MAIKYFEILHVLISANYLRRHTCDLSRSGVNLPIWRLPLGPPDEAAKIPIFMNSDFSLLPKAKTCFPITADQGYRNFEIQIGSLARWRHRRHTNMSSTIPNSHENSSFSSKSVSEIGYFSDTVQLQPVVSKRSRDNPKSLA